MLQRRRFWVGTAATPPPVVVETPTQIPGGKRPVLRPTYDHLLELRAGETGATIRTIRTIRERGERSTRQEVPV